MTRARSINRYVVQVLTRTGGWQTTWWCDPAGVTLIEAEKAASMAARAAKGREFRAVLLRAAENAPFREDVNAPKEKINAAHD